MLTLAVKISIENCQGIQSRVPEYEENHNAGSTLYTYGADTCRAYVATNMPSLQDGIAIKSFMVQRDACG